MQFFICGWGQVSERLNYLITFVRGDKDVAINPSKLKLKITTFVIANGIFALVFIDNFFLTSVPVFYPSDNYFRNDTGCGSLPSKDTKTHHPTDHPEKKI